MSGVLSMGPEIIRLGMRLQAISLHRSVRISHHLLLHTFGAPTLLVHALVPFVFPLQVGTMIQESPSKFFPTASEISGRVPRRTTTFAMASIHHEEQVIVHLNMFFLLDEYFPNSFYLCQLLHERINLSKE
jgi:hypothetical protein